MPSSLRIAADKLARMVALSATFAGEDSYADSLARVYRRNAVGMPRPCACIAQGERHALTLIAGGAQNYLRASGQLGLYLAVDTPEDYISDLVQTEQYAADWFGSVVEEIAELSNADDPGHDESHLAITRIERVDFSEVPEDHWQSLGRFYWAFYTVDWGDGDQ